MKLKNKVIMVDFDGTIVEHKYPEIGDAKPHAFEVLKEFKAEGAKLILWTCREDMRKRKYLTEAISFCKDNGVEFDAVNEALYATDFRDPDECDLRKPHAHCVIDDINVGGFLGWENIRKIILQKYVPVWSTATTDAHYLIKQQLKEVGETQKAKPRRLKEGWFEKYAPDHLSGIDIGCSHDPLNQTFRRWDVAFGDSDATYMDEVEDNTFHTVYASHILEHLNNPIVAIQNWYRILKTNGHLIICVPHRDLYEKRIELPSQWNPAHKLFYLLDKTEAPCTVSLKDLVTRALPEPDIVSMRVIDTDYNAGSEKDHPNGEYSIELIVRKK